jgi:hypothetical protein
MAKTVARVSYCIPTEIEPGVWDDQVIAVDYPADITRLNSRWSTNTDSTNDNVSLNSQISFVADAFAIVNFALIKHVNVYGVEWKVTNVEVQHPRIMLTLGGVYNG